jgi:hypothetical protein
MSRARRRPGFREALRAYVAGHDRVATAESKMSHTVGAEAEAEVIWDGEWTRSSTEHARYGVAIPDRLEFHRGPATWRQDDGGAVRPSGENDAT